MPLSRPTGTRILSLLAVLSISKVIITPSRPRVNSISSLFCEAFPVRSVVPSSVFLEQHSAALSHSKRRSCEAIVRGEGLLTTRWASSRWLELEPRRAACVALSMASPQGGLNRRSAEDWEGVSKAGLRELRRQIDDPEGSSAAEMIATLVNEVIVDGQDFLTTEANVILQRSPQLTEAAEAGEILAGLSASPRAAMAAAEACAESEYFLLQNLEKEVVAELQTPWAVSVKKWRQKALAVEKYRSTNPVANAAVYTYMANCCIRQGMWEVAYDALTYAGLMSAGPFFVSRKELGLGDDDFPSVVLDVDRMACYVAEKILDIDLDVWRRRGGDLTAGAGTVGNKKPGVGIEEINFSQKDDSATHLAALRVQDMTLATTRAALRKIRAELRASLTSEAGKNGSLVILSSATSNVLYLRELLLPGRAIETLLSLDFAEPVASDAGLGQRLSKDPEIAAALGLLTEAPSQPIVVRGEALEAWLVQSDDARLEEERS